MANKLVLELLADANGLVKGLQSAQKSVDRFIDSSSSAGHALGSGVNRALEAFESLASGGAAAAGVLAGGLAAAAAGAVALTLSAGKQVEALDHLAQKTGIQIQTLQGWSVVMAENNFQAESLTTGMRTLSKQILDAQDPASAAAQTFEEMGISIKDLGSTEAVIRGVADRFKAMPDGAEKARLAIQLFGKSGLELIPILNKGSAAFDESKQAAQRFGLVLSHDQVQALNAADDASDRLGQSLQGLKLQLAATFAGTVTHGIDKLTEGIATLTNITRNYSAALEEVKKNHPIMAALSPGLTSAAAAARAAQMPPPPPDAGPPAPMDAHVQAAGVANAEEQVKLGTKLRDQAIERFRLLQSEGRAQEALGKVSNAIAEREKAERNQAFAEQVMEMERINALNQEFHKPPSEDSPFVKSIREREAAIKNLQHLMPELTPNEAEQLYLHNVQAANQAIGESLTAYEHRNDALELEINRLKAIDAEQSAMYADEAGLIGASDAARQARMNLIEAEAALQKQRIMEEGILEEQKAEKLRNLDQETDARRRRTAQEFPTFFEQQLQAIVASNTFSMGQMVSTWSNGIANMVVHGGNLQAVWEQTQVAMVQAALNAAVQHAASAALAASANTAAATTSAAVWEAASGGIIAAIATVGAAAKALWVEAILPAIMAVGEAIMAFLTAVASAMEATIFGIPVGIAIMVGVVAIAAALAAMGAIKFADGGIATGPTNAMIGEAGSSEAVIPLNRRGAAFMQSMLGMGSGAVGRVEVPVYLNGREIARAVVDDLPKALTKTGVPAFGRL